MVFKNCVTAKSLLLALALALLACPPILAEDSEKNEEEGVTVVDEMVVTATRTETPLEETTKSVEVVGKEEMEDRQQYFMPELLDSLPGVYLRRTGGMGQWGVVNIRGAGSQYTQFQYNGLPMRDIADTQGSFQYFIEDMYAGSNVDRIEVLKGTNSVLYGSQAMGGVINVMPEKWDSGLKAEARAEIGANKTLISNGRLAYGQEKFYIDLNPMYQTTDGETYGGDYGYGYRNTGMTFSSGVKAFENASLEFTGMLTDSELDMGESPKIDENGKLVPQRAYDDRWRESKLDQMGLIWNHSVTQTWDYSLKGSHTETERHYYWSKTDGHNSNYDGEADYMEMQHNLYLADWVTLTLGADYEKQEYKGEEPRNIYANDYSRVHFNETWDVWDLFAQTQFAFMDRTLFFNLGGRYNNPEEFDDKTVWEVSAAYLLDATGTKFHAHAGTGYRTPSLYEVYGGYLWDGNLVTVGNPDLKPEESTSCEFGIDQSFFDGKVKTGATIYYTEFEDQIGFDSTIYKYENTSESDAHGVETYINFRPFRELKLDLAYTYADLDGETRLPRHKFDLVASYYPTDKVTIACDVDYQHDKTVEISGVDVEENYDPIVNLAVTFRPLEHMEVFSRIHNLFDTDYTESGYVMPDFTLTGGVRLYF